ncbi:MAG: hypothetical protein WCI51_14440 [Lentisphaerota bacterium]
MVTILKYTVVGTAMLCVVSCVGVEERPSTQDILMANVAPIVKPFALKYDFEDGRFPAIKPLAANGKFTVNSMGITDEKAFSGAKSFKFEITVESGNYFTWLIPFNVSAEGRLKMSYRYQVATTGKGKFGPGVSFHYPCIGSVDKVDFFDWVNSTGGGWTWLDIDLTSFAKNRIIRRDGGGWKIQPTQVMADVKGMVICFDNMSPGERITLYIDDFMVEGETQEMTEDFNRLAVEQWLPVKEKHSAIIKKMQDAISYDYWFLETCANTSQSAALLQQTARTHLTAWAAITQTATKRGYVLNKEIAEADQHEAKVNSLMANVFMLKGYDFTK